MASDKQSAGGLWQGILLKVALPFAAGFILLALMPWAEIGMPVGSHLHPLQIGPFTVDLSCCRGLYDAVSNQLPLFVAAAGDPNYNFYVYSFFLAVAFIAASLALHLIGREESQEKTVLPVKK